MLRTQNAKLMSGTLRSALKTVNYNGKLIFNPPEDVLLDMGYFPVTYTDMPTDASTGQHYESHWEQTDTEITQVWKLVDDPIYPTPEPTPEERIINLETTTDELKSTSDDIILMMADLIGGQE